MHAAHAGIDHLRQLALVEHRFLKRDLLRREAGFPHEPHLGLVRRQNIETLLAQDRENRRLVIRFRAVAQHDVGPGGAQTVAQLVRVRAQARFIRDEQWRTETCGDLAEIQGALRYHRPRVRDLLDIPFNRHLGMQTVERSAERVILSLPPQDWFLQEGGVIHGGIITSLADTAAVYLIYPELPADRLMTSIEFKVNFLRPARVGDGDLTATASAVKIGKQVAVCSVDVHQRGAAVATGLFTYLIFSRPAA